MSFFLFPLHRRTLDFCSSCPTLLFTFLVGPFPCEILQDIATKLKNWEDNIVRMARSLIPSQGYAGGPECNKVSPELLSSSKWSGDIGIRTCGWQGIRAHSPRERKCAGGKRTSFRVWHTLLVTNLRVPHAWSINGKVAFEGDP
jgi:hypothetical protein